MFDLTAGRCEMTLDGTCSILVCYPASSSEEFRLTLNSQLQRECVSVCVCGLLRVSYITRKADCKQMTAVSSCCS